MLSLGSSERERFGVPHPDTCTAFAPPEHPRTVVAATIAGAVLRLVPGARGGTALKVLGKCSPDADDALPVRCPGSFPQP